MEVKRVSGKERNGGRKRGREKKYTKVSNN